MQGYCSSQIYRDDANPRDNVLATRFGQPPAPATISGPFSKPPEPRYLKDQTLVVAITSKGYLN